MIPKTILVTGVAGFVGSNFATAFHKRFPDTKIVAIDDFSTGRRDAVPGGVTVYEGSITDVTLVGRVFAENAPEYVFHFAALPRVAYSVEHPAETTLVNVYGTTLLLEASRDHGTKRFIFSSSCAVYGPDVTLPTREDDPKLRAVSPYGAQKLACEPLVRVAAELSPLDTVSLRYFNVFGPGQYGDSPYSTVVAAWLTGLYFPAIKKPFLEGDGLQAKDYCYVDNVIAANILAMQYEGRLAGDVLNVGSGEKVSLREIQVLIEEFTGKKLELEQRPPREGDIRFAQADLAKAERVLGWKPLVPFREGVRRTVEWFESRKL